MKTNFFKEFLQLTGIDEEIKKTQLLAHPSIADSHDKLFSPVQKQIIQTHFPKDLSKQIHKFYKSMSGLFREISLNVFSSSTNNKSISYSDVLGDANLILKIKKIYSLSMRESVAIVVQENIKGIKGKIVTSNPIANAKLTVKQINELLNYCKIIKKHFYFPHELEYVGTKDKVLITNIFPYTGTVSPPTKKQILNFDKRNFIAKGISINLGIVTGKIKVFQKFEKVEAKKGDIIVLNKLDHLMFKKIKNAKAVILDSALPSSLDKMLFRKGFHMPAIEGVKDAVKIFKNGIIVTVNGVTGEIFLGGLI